MNRRVCLGPGGSARIDVGSDGRLIYLLNPTRWALLLFPAAAARKNLLR